MNSTDKKQIQLHKKELDKRIMRLLIDKDLITPMSIFSINLYAIADIKFFVKANIKKHRN